jgi:hypothetical protein
MYIDGTDTTDDCGCGCEDDGSNNIRFVADNMVPDNGEFSLDLSGIIIPYTSYSILSGTVAYGNPLALADYDVAIIKTTNMALVVSAYAGIFSLTTVLTPDLVADIAIGYTKYDYIITLVNTTPTLPINTFLDAAYGAGTWETIVPSGLGVDLPTADIALTGSIIVQDGVDSVSYIEHTSGMCVLVTFTIGVFTGSTLQGDGISVANQIASTGDYFYNGYESSYIPPIMILPKTAAAVELLATVADATHYVVLIKNQ